MSRLLLALTTWCLVIAVGTAAEGDKPYRPEAGKFPALDHSLAYRGELVFVDHANRRGSLRVRSSGVFFQNAPRPFALLPYGIVRYHGAPADLRDVPLGTVMHVRAYLPPDPATSAVPVLPLDNKDAVNHVLLLEDEPSHCQRAGSVWNLTEVTLKNNAGMIVARCEAKAGGDAKADDEQMTIDAATRIWRGRECLSLAELVAEGAWPADGKKSLDGQPVQLGITWRPTPDGIFNRFHISDIWLDDIAMQRAAANQNETHKAFIRSRWMPAFVDAVAYGAFGRATVTATLFGGMDETLYADFRKGGGAMMNAAENTLKHDQGACGPQHMASAGSLVDVTRMDGDVPLGSSGIRIRLETDLITEGLRPGCVVRVRPDNWPVVQLPREEFINDGDITERFPGPGIFPKY